MLSLMPNSEGFSHDVRVEHVKLRGRRSFRSIELSIACEADNKNKEFFFLFRDAAESFLQKFAYVMLGIKLIIVHSTCTQTFFFEALEEFGYDSSGLCLSF